MSIYVGYITTKIPVLQDLDKIAMYTPGPAVRDVLCDTQFVYNKLNDLYFAVYQIRLHENASTADHMFFVCEEGVYTPGADNMARDVSVRTILTEFYTTHAEACYIVDPDDETAPVFKVTGLDNKGLSDLFAQVARYNRAAVRPT